MTDVTGTNKERYDKTIRRREKLAGYYFDMSKLIFAATVLANFNALKGDIVIIDILQFVIGIGCTVVFAAIGNSVLKF